MNPFEFIDKTKMAALLCLCLVVSTARASAPAQFNYQGKLSDAAGNPITRAAQPMHINIYNTQTHGSSLFNETHMARVSNGVFSLPIGSINPGLEAVLQDNPDVWLEIIVGSTVLSPRQKLVASPYALSVSNNSIGSDEIKDNSITQSDLSEQSVGADQIIDNTVTSADILNGTVVNDDISPAAGIALSKLAAEVLTAGGTRTQANLDTLTAGPASNADPLHTHIGLTPGDHAGTHMPGGGDSLESAYLTIGTAQEISGQKTFNNTGAPFVLGANAADRLVPGLNADLLDGQSASDFAASVHAHAAGDISSGVLDIARGGTGTGSLLSGVLLGGDPVSSLSAAAGRQFLKRNAANTDYEFSAIEDADIPDNITAGNYLPLSGGAIDGGDLVIEPGNNLCLDGQCESSWPDTGPWTVVTSPNKYIWLDLNTHGNVGIGAQPVSAALQINGDIALSGRVDGYDISVSGPVWDDDQVDDSVSGAELEADVFNAAPAGLLQKQGAGSYNTIASLSGGTGGYIEDESITADDLAPASVGSSELECANDDELLRGGTAGCVSYSNWDTNAGNDLTSSTVFGGDVSGRYNNIQVIDDSHNHSNYIPATTGFGGDVSGTYDNLQVRNNSHSHSSYLRTTTDFGGDVSGRYGSLQVSDDSHSHSNYLPLSGGRLTNSIMVEGNVNATGEVVAISKLTVGGDAGIRGHLSAGSVSASVKAFVIDHPLDPEKKQLVHTSLEGPEVGVYYRGEANLSDGQAVVQLPDYFEKLTRPQNRTVQLTAKGTTPFALSAGQVENNRFTVYGTKSNGEFYWEVKAERADLPPLEVEKIKKH